MGCLGDVRLTHATAGEHATHGAIRAAVPDVMHPATSHARGCPPAAASPRRRAHHACCHLALPAPPQPDARPAGAAGAAPQPRHAAAADGGRPGAHLPHGPHPAGGGWGLGPPHTNRPARQQWGAAAPAARRPQRRVCRRAPRPTCLPFGRPPAPRPLSTPQVSLERYIDIPQEILDVYKLWR